MNDIGPYLLGYGTWYGTSRSTIPKPKAKAT
jgi:hypothetical protein